MAWKYLFYRFLSRETFIEVGKALGWESGEHGLPQPSHDLGDLVITGIIDGAEGYYVAAAWRQIPEGLADYEIPGPAIGMAVFAGWNGPQIVGPLVDKTELLDLLTDAEQILFITTNDPAVAWWRYRAVTQDGKIDLRSPKVDAALQVLVDNGILTAERKEQVKAGRVPA